MIKRVIHLAAAVGLCLTFAAQAAVDTPAKLNAGDVPPPSIGLSRQGDSLEATQFAGKVLVVTFWASWCGPCRAEISYLEALQRKVSKDLLQVVAVNIEEREMFREVTRKMNDLQITLAHDRSKRAAESYGVKGIPHMVIIGKDGKVVSVHRGYSESSIPGLVNEIVGALYQGVGKQTLAER